MSDIDNLNPSAFIEDPYTLFIIDNVTENISNVSGINNTQTNEIKTNFNSTEGEKVIEGDTNCFIILGRDRNAGIASGMGGKGHTGAAAIDIVAGHMGYAPINKLYFEEKKTDKDFKNDAARIYLSQMSDIDEYFEIPKIQMKLGNNMLDLEQTKGTSAIGIKADNVRIISRESIKIVTNHNGVNSLNRKASNGGIDIIAGYNLATLDPHMSLQPMVKGNNLVELLKEIVRRMEDVQATVATFLEKQGNINNLFLEHTHQSGNAGEETSRLIQEQGRMENFKLLTDVLPDILKNFIGKASLEGVYFTASSPKYINSIWNRVN